MIAPAPAKLVLTRTDILQKIKRMAFEIYEHNTEEQSLVLAGIRGQGYLVAERLAAELRQLSPLQITLLEISVNKQMPLESPVTLSNAPDGLRHQVVVVVDDVLKSGRTLMYSLRPFLDIPLKKLETAVLIDRGYPRFPVLATYVGYRLATTLQEHVEVVFKGAEPEGAYLQ